MEPNSAFDAVATGTEVQSMWALLRPPRFGGANHATVTTIGLDIAKSAFQIHGIDGAAKVIFRQAQAPLRFAILPEAKVGHLLRETLHRIAFCGSLSRCGAWALSVSLHWRCMSCLALSLESLWCCLPLARH
jgi:hypothetical protein